MNGKSDGLIPTVPILFVLLSIIVNVSVVMYTLKRTKLSQGDVDNFNSQYPSLEVRYTKVFHDRFLILDKKNAYHIGASLKDAGKKCFGITLLEDDGIVRDILQRLELETEE